MTYAMKQLGRDIIAIDCPFPEALAVMEGNNPGWIFLDDPISPRAALVWSQGIEGFYLVGDVNCKAFYKELHAFTDLTLKPRLQNLGVDRFEISGGNSWDPVIESVFEKRKPETSIQWIYTMKPSRRLTPKPIASADDCQLLTVDYKLVRDAPLGVELLFSKLIKFWGSVERFLDAGLGYVLVVEDKVASLCISGFVTGNIHVVDIETAVAYRRRGYAEIVSCAFHSECMKKHFRLHWDCMAENCPSARLAEKLGFARSHEYILHSFPL